LDKKANHQANIVQLGAPRVHTNAETLELFDIPGTGYQVVSKKGTFKQGDLAVYIQPDSVVPQTTAFQWIWEPYSTATVEDGYGTVYTDVPEKRRRITVKKLRGEYSEGLLMPLSDFSEWSMDPVYSEGTDVSDLIGITHYNPETESTKADTAHAPKTKRTRPKSLKGWFFFLLYKIGFRKNSTGQSYAVDVPFEAPVYDVENFKNFKNALLEGEMVTVTEKIHGSNARYVVVDGEFYAGSHFQWKKKGDNVWWKAADQCPAIEKFCRANPGHILYGEVTPTQKGWTYGCKPGEARFFAFDIRTPDGKWLNPFYTCDMPCVPVLAAGHFNADLLRHANGPSTAPGTNHMREGCVIRPLTERHERGLGRVHLKVVSNAFLEKDSRD
jgi:hypothetical protein